MIQLTTQPAHPRISDEILKGLRDGLATSTSHRGLSPEARSAIARLCGVARENSWTPEQLVIVVKEACYSSAEISHLTATDREALLSTIVSRCIREFYTPQAD